MVFEKDLKNFNLLSPLKRNQTTQEYVDKLIHFSYDNREDILRDLQDEINELDEEMKKQDKSKNNKQRVFEELGDVLFVLGNLANRYNIDCEKALTYSIDEYERRMIFCEENYKGDITKIDKQTMIKLWKKAKSKNCSK